MFAGPQHGIERFRRKSLRPYLSKLPAAPLEGRKHPVHIHLESQQWQKLNGNLPALRDQFKQDAVILGSGDEVELFMKFRTWCGSFVFHCHNLEHEDMRMMFNMDPRLLPTESPQQTQNLFP